MKASTVAFYWGFAILTGFGPIASMIYHDPRWLWLDVPFVGFAAMSLLSLFMVDMIQRRIERAERQAE